MSFKASFYSSLIFLSSLFGSEYSFDMNAEALNQFSHKIGDELSSRLSLLVNDNGEVVWTELNPIRPEFDSCFHQMFYWSESTGVIEIDIDNEMHKLGFRRMEQGRTKAPGYQVSFQRLDNYGNVFLDISIDLRETMPSCRYTGIRKIGVWNKKYGFKMLNIPNIDTVKEIKFSKDHIFVIGENMTQVETFAVLRPTEDHWPWEPEPEAIKTPSIKLAETTPWDSLPYGKHSGRLHVLKQLLKKTKDSAEKKANMVMLEAEVANLFDILQYDVKRAESRIAKAKSKGQENAKAKEARDKAKKHINALLGYFNTLPKDSKTRIDAIRLPSNEWFP
ncbi:MAG: hypothetical protein JSR37_08505 [Verrucomicrobia bacterium]|nr:hypothetical protein [Verrucomicrobiota bacterium]